ncbi:MAG: helix-turn-helix domain-containing protein [Halomonas sp.]|nr:helix-turn-helix domain-containing protein [Halomonas sp.]MBP5979081.1 helix-turn-helix domain-containing protein [Halomonas sp.]
MQERYVSTSELCKRYGRSRNTLLRWRMTKGFPRPVIQGGHGAESRWRESDLKAWEDKQVFGN